MADSEERSWTVLHQAVSDGDVELAQQLLASGDTNVLINKKDVSGWTPLVVAARLGHLPSMRLLLQHPRVDIEARDDSKCTALRHALGTGHNAAACELLMAGADARNGLLPFIMLDTYNRLMAYMEQTTAELEAELEPHKLLRHKLALLLYKHGIEPPTKKLQQPHPNQPNATHTLDMDVQHCSDQGRGRHTQQKSTQPRQPIIGMILKGVHRDAAEIQHAALRVKQLQQELQPIRSCPFPPAMVHAIVALVQASQDPASTEPEVSGPGLQMPVQDAHTQQESSDFVPAQFLGCTLA